MQICCSIYTRKGKKHALLTVNQTLIKGKCFRAVDQSERWQKKLISIFSHQSEHVIIGISCSFSGLEE